MTSGCKRRAVDLILSADEMDASNAASRIVDASHAASRLMEAAKECLKMAAEKWEEAGEDTESITRGFSTMVDTFNRNYELNTNLRRTIEGAKR